jgi:hypothetical protein
MAKRRVGQGLVAVCPFADREIPALALLALAADDRKGITTRSPTFNLLFTAGPTSTTSPIVSWPMMSPDFIVGMK